MQVISIGDRQGIGVTNKNIKPRILCLLLSIARKQKREHPQKIVVKYLFKKKKIISENHTP